MRLVLRRDRDGGALERIDMESMGARLDDEEEVTEPEGSCS